MNGACYLLKHWVHRTGFSDGLMAQAALFFILSLTTSVFAIGSETELLVRVVPGLIWVLLLLSSLLGLPDLLNRDAQDGLLDDMVLSKQPLPLLMAMKGISHFISTGLPLSIMGPVIIYAIAPESSFDLRLIFLSLVAGSVYFSGLGLMAAAMVLQARRSFALYAAIVLPLAIPGLIFGAGSLSMQAMNITTHAGFFLLSACAAAICTLSPFASAWIVRMKVSS